MKNQELPAPLHAECNHGKTETKHTPTPWKRHGLFGRNIYGPMKGENQLLAACYMARNEEKSSGEGEANAAFIVRAVNAYQNDQEIIKAFADYDCEQPDGIGCERYDAKNGAGSPTCWPCKARQAIAKAEGV